MKRILVTGANKGIGRALVEVLLDERDDVHVLLGSRSAERGNAARDEILAGKSGLDARLEVVELDVSSDDSVAAATSTIGELYAVVNNAGIGFGASDLAGVLDVNTRGVQRVCEAVIGKLESGGRVVNITSAAGPNFVNKCSAERQAFFLDGSTEWSDLEKVMADAIAAGGDGEALGLADLEPYGLSKALANTYTLQLARRNPGLKVNACTPGFIATDLTRPYAEAKGVTPADMGMKSPREGTRSAMHLLFGELEGNGWYYGSDAQRSPLDRYRAPGDPPYTGE